MKLCHHISFNVLHIRKSYLLRWILHFRKQEKVVQSRLSENGKCCTCTILCFAKNCWSKRYGDILHNSFQIDSDMSRQNLDIITLLYKLLCYLYLNFKIQKFSLYTFWSHLICNFYTHSHKHHNKNINKDFIFFYSHKISNKYLT